MELKEAKLLFDAGGLKNIEILYEQFSEGWIIIFERKKDGKWVNDNYTSRRSDSIKTFKDLRAAVNIVKKMGFNEVLIVDLQK